MTDALAHRALVDATTECALIGCLILGGRDVLDAVCDHVSAGHYATRECAAAHAAIVELDADGMAIDTTTVTTQLAGTVDAEWVLAVTQVIPTLSSAETYARRVRALADRRAMVEVARRAQAQGHDLTITADEYLDATEAAVLAVAERRHGSDRAATFDAVAGELLLQLAQPPSIAPGVPSGLSRLDAMLGGGAHPGQLIIVAGRPGMGKTQIATGWGTSAARRAHPVLASTMEMERTEYVSRIVAAECGVNLSAITTRRLVAGDARRVTAAMNELHSLPLVIDDTPAITLASLRARCRRVARQYGRLGLVTVDYLQLMSRPATGRRDEREDQQIGALSRGLKALARELRCPVVVLSQLNRRSEERADHRPQLSDLRASGEIEQDADVVILIHGPTDRTGAREEGIADLILAKQRNGPTGTVRVAWLAEQARFADLTTGSERYA